MFALPPTITYIEDVFSHFFERIDYKSIPIQRQDLSAAESFYNVILNGTALTASQANFVLTILSKYKTYSADTGFDYSSQLAEPKWKKPFRVINLSKRIWVEKEEREIPYVCMMFPYQLKNAFEAEFKDLSRSTWDNERKLRRTPVYSCNLIQLHEFAIKNNFELDDSFLIALGEVEEIWQNQEDVLPLSTLKDNSVVLENASEESVQWFNDHATGKKGNDLLLAKSMGYMYSGASTDRLTKIAASTSNHFWIKTNEDLFSVFNQVDGTMCVVLDRTGNTLEWLKEFTSDALASGVAREDIKVCFRSPRDGQMPINQWIKDNEFGGKVEGGKIFIFEHKPAKWLFKKQESVKLLVTNNIYPPTNLITRDWMNTHPCVVYLGDIKPSEARKNKIVEL